MSNCYGLQRGLDPKVVHRIALKMARAQKIGMLCNTTKKRFSMGRSQNEPTQSDRTTWHAWGLQTIEGPFFVVLTIMAMVCWGVFWQ